MRIVRLTCLAAALAVAAAPALLQASDQAVPSKDNTTSTVTAAPSQFTALKGVKAVPMSSSELKAVKGLHVHFITLSNGSLHLAGDVKTENNWSNEWGGSDGKAVAPSYHGLCVAQGNGQIFIPTGPPGTPVTLQCPAGS
jgi:hypothetical protein